MTTPQIVSAGALESTIDTLPVEGVGELHSSPEIEMKRILSEIAIPIFQICKSFRDDPQTGIHFKEFTMLEYYRPDCAVDGIFEVTQNLINALSPHSLQWESVSIQSRMVELLGEPPPQDRDAFISLVKKTGILLSPNDTWNDVFFKILVEKIEPFLHPSNPTIVLDFPARVSPLATATPAGIAERFEIYWKGMEICNGCEELTDAKLLLERAQIEAQGRKAAGKEPHPPATTLYQALEKGLPQCSGVAVGLDRLYYCLAGEWLGI